MSAHLSFVRFCSDVLHVRLTRPQRVWASVVFDDVDPADLTGADRDIAFKLFGAVERIPEEARHTVALLKGARAGGSWVCALGMLWLGLTADLSGLAAGERAYAPIVAPDLRLAGQALRYIIGAATASPDLHRLIVTSSTTSLVLRRHDGQEVEFIALPASRGGAATRGRSFFGALMDESSFFRDADTGTVNDSEVFRSLAPRILPNGRLLIISTAWAESGLLWDLTRENRGDPKTAVAAIAPTLLMRPDSKRLRQVVEGEQQRDPQNSAREFDCIPFAQGSGFFFDSAALKSATIVRPIALEPDLSCPAAAAVDLGFRSDSSAVCVVRKEGDRYRVVELLELTPKKGQPLVPSVVVATFAAVAKRHGCTTMVADFAYVESLREHAQAAGLQIVTAPAGITGKLKVHTAARTLLHEGACEFATGHKHLLAQLKEVASKPTPGGQLSISSPRRRGRHGDLASAWVLAVWAASSRASVKGVYTSLRNRSGSTRHANLSASVADHATSFCNWTSGGDPLAGSGTAIYAPLDRETRASRRARRRQHNN